MLWWSFDANSLHGMQSKIKQIYNMEYVTKAMEPVRFFPNEYPVLYRWVTARQT